MSVSSSGATRASTTGARFGTVEVRCRAAGAATEVEVTYRLTAMTAAAGRELERFAAGYEAMMEAWGARIRAVLLPRDG